MASVSERPPSTSSTTKKQDYGTTQVPSIDRDIEHAPIQDENHRLHRGLSARQVQMIAIAGTIGTGLFLGALVSKFNTAPKAKDSLNLDRNWSFSFPRWPCKSSHMLCFRRVHRIRYITASGRDGNSISCRWIVQCIRNSVLLTIIWICSILELLV